MDHLDPHQRPPDSIKHVYKKYQKMTPKDLDQDPDIVDLPDTLQTSAKGQVRIVEEWTGHDLTAAFRAFSGQEGEVYAALPTRMPVYEHVDMPGKVSMLHVFCFMCLVGVCYYYHCRFVFISILVRKFFTAPRTLRLNP